MSASVPPLPTPEALRDILDAGGTRPAPYWPSTPEPPADAPFLARRAYQQEVRRCWDRRMALVEQCIKARTRSQEQ